MPIIYEYGFFQTINKHRLSKPLDVRVWNVFELFGRASLFIAAQTTNRCATLITLKKRAVDI